MVEVDADGEDLDGRRFGPTAVGGLWRVAEHLVVEAGGQLAESGEGVVLGVVGGGHGVILERMGTVSTAGRRRPPHSRTRSGR